MQALFTVLFFTLVFSFTSAQSELQFDETWAGKIMTDSIGVQAVMYVSNSDTSDYIVSLSFPDQFTYNLKPGKQSKTCDSLFFEIKKIGAKYSGFFDKVSGKIKGMWCQGGKDFQLDFAKTDKDFSLKRPQTPVKPYPYIEEEVVFENPKDGAQLSGTLTIPEGKGPFPAVVIINGSGQQERDCEIMGHKWALVLADYLCRQGIATLRYDDRGTGKSGGNPFTSTTLDFAGDAASAYLLLKQHKKADMNKTGIIGHSEGGIIAPMVASRLKGVSFLVLLAAPGIDITELMVIQNRKMVESENILRPEQYDAFNVMLHDVFNTVVKTKDNNEASKKIMSIYSEYAKTIDSVQVVKMQLTEKSVRQQLIPLLSPWYRYFLSIKPSVFVSKVKCPVIAVNGDKDMQVTADENLAALNDAFKTAGNINCTVKKMKDKNHLFQTAVTGMPDEYAKTEETISPELLEMISNWIKQQ